MIYDEIVIGAGIAGLYWIYKTKPSNYLVLEKSNRIGGRIYNINWNGSQISLGGGIIKSSNDYIINLANEFGLNLSDSISKYEMIDWVEDNEKKSNNQNEANKLNKPNESNKPNEANFYTLNTNIIKYLKKIYQSNKNEIDNNKINFEEFLDLYVELKISQLIKLNFLYKTYFNADVYSVLYDEIDELLRTQDFHYKYITNGGYTLILDKLIEIVGKKNIITNTNVIEINKNNDVIEINKNNDVIEINKNNDVFEIITNSNIIYRTKKIILATESTNGIIWNLSNQTISNKITELYKLVSGSNYIRIYSYHKDSHGLKYSYKTSGLAGKVILINDKILMCSYTEEQDSIKLKKLLENKTKSTQLEIIYKLLNKSNIPITKPDDIIIKFWNSGVHYNNPGYNKDIKKSFISELKKENIIVIGECISDSHGWVNSALESVEFVLNL
jgi:hypothetical protein